MRIRIPFDIKYRPQIESGEYRVETQAGCPVRIVCWDMACELPILGLVLLNDEKAEETAVGFTNEGTNLLGDPLYDKLFIVTPEEELTEFEKAIKRAFICIGCGSVSNGIIKDTADELLALARKQLIEEQYTSDPRKTDLYKLGKAEALKDLPRWKTINKDDNAIVRIPYVGTNILGERMLYIGENAISIRRLTKLPGFKED